MIKARKIRSDRKNLLTHCLECGKEFRTSACYIKRGFDKFCSRQCFHNHRPKRIIDGCGYICLYDKTHPFRSAKNYVKEHRIIAEKVIGRFLDNKEVIHHLNGDKTDNRPENLYYFKNHSEHMRYHLNLKWKNVTPIFETNLFKLQTI